MKAWVASVPAVLCVLACATVDRGFGSGDEEAVAAEPEPDPASTEEEEAGDASAPLGGAGGTTSPNLAVSSAAGGNGGVPAAVGSPNGGSGQTDTGGSEPFGDPAGSGGDATGVAGVGGTAPLLPSLGGTGGAATTSSTSGMAGAGPGGAENVGGTGAGGGAGASNGGAAAVGAGGVAAGGMPNAGGAALGGAAAGGAGGAPSECAPEFLASCGVDCTTLSGPELVVVPGGSLAIGSNDLPNTQPPVTFSFDNFCMDRTEVTVEQYRECVDADVCSAPDYEQFSDCNWEIAGRDDHPVTCVGRDAAVTYCEWAGKRLPNEREWEYAARGSAGRLYPWGDSAPDQTRLNWQPSLIAITTPVQSYAAGATPDTQLFDLSGNVWEWVDGDWCDSHQPGAVCTAGVHVAKGGSYASSLPEHVRPSWRDNDNAGDARFGFRCIAGAGQQ